MARAVLFDFGGTLDADGLTWCERFHVGYLGVGGHEGSAAFKGWFALAEQRLAGDAEIGVAGFERMVEIQVALLRELLPDGRGLDPVGWRNSFVASTRAIAARNRPLLEQLSRDRELGVISNFTGNLEPCLEELGLQHCFAVVLDSAVVGLRKPDLRFFRMAFAALSRRPDDCWVVGDNPFFDIEPATRLGASTCWLAPGSRATPPGLLPTSRISSLDELPAVLS